MLIAGPAAAIRSSAPADGIGPPSCATPPSSQSVMPAHLHAVALGDDRVRELVGEQRAEEEDDRDERDDPELDVD